ncbi:MAG: hypothetical protein IAF38_00575 [Bacteroidia bacterium]|nr:hypothetical protein [Bacteroidia bacterium]
MKKSVIFFCFGLFFCFAMNAQTKRIFHRAHSGSNEKFSISSLGNFGDIDFLVLDTVPKTPVKKLRVIKSDSAGTKPKKDVQGKTQPVAPKNRVKLATQNKNSGVK